eukprot:Plantae.Rhodophyta-Hildenbrandia_rubra.ctg1270.p3 GENE.Plantae.Rhodophyta-Hildenbrandia_rubra.ctg1270~~Plantae.Rhodophyta-Hildenbrandia_rubra.ctg1270.p3  ORF type:complete len:498 (-),score=95.08 Plantae.Rhodophyta-Hildenbrandia_rubra.ctg1270:5997-7490(-)
MAFVTSISTLYNHHGTSNSHFAFSSTFIPLPVALTFSLPPHIPHQTRAAPLMILPDVPDKSLRVMVVGSGGREHSLVEAISKSRYCREVIAAPGNIGMENHCRRCANVNAEDVDGIVETARKEKVDFVVVGPEVALVSGVIDELDHYGILGFGPRKLAARLEGSKGFAKECMMKWGVDTAKGGTFKDVESAMGLVNELGGECVVKADGLAAGKGVMLVEGSDRAREAIEDVLVRKKFGKETGKKVVVEELLEGEEVSFFAMVDGKKAVALDSAQDHKAAFEGDNGPNTGGMGAYSPAPLCDNTLENMIMEKVVKPVVKGMKEEEGCAFQGVLFCGMMVDKKKNTAKVLEFNVRFGDPECQVLCERLETDMLELLYRTSKGTLGEDGFSVNWKPISSMIVVLATKGYPGLYEKGSIIRGIEKANAIPNIKVYHAGTVRSEDGEIVSAGGRVLGVVGSGKTLQEARDRAYEGVDSIDWSQGFCRRDIGWRALKQVAGLR